MTVTDLHKPPGQEDIQMRLYGTAKTTAGRSIWALEELGLRYQIVPMDLQQQETRKPQYLAINPNGRIPTLVDGDVVMYESMAINFYLVRRYGGDLRPRTPEGFDAALMWSFWTISETETLVRTLVRNRLFLHEDDRSVEAADRAEALLKAAIYVLDLHLRKQNYILGDYFSIADVNAAHGLMWLPHLHIDMGPFAFVGRWLERCALRSAYQRVHGGQLRFELGDKLRRGAHDPRLGTVILA